MRVVESTNTPVIVWPVLTNIEQDVGGALTPSCAHDYIWSSVFFLLACSLLPSLSAPTSLFVTVFSSYISAVLQIRLHSLKPIQVSVCSWFYFCFFTHLLPQTHSCIFTPLSLFLSVSVTCRVVSVVVGNGLNSPHSGDRDGPADRQSTMPPSVPIRKDKKDVPVSCSSPGSSSVDVYTKLASVKPLNFIKRHDVVGQINKSGRK